ncbi:MAG: hypothetical protein JO186_06615 [Actinobacteria bacterium]|nr:hypothetical protein [Actinomycetota bacterium]MBV8396663.1 hypothetical protein [Actinomycetota bacterium]
MRKLVALLVALAAAGGPAAWAATRPLSGSALLAVDKRAGFRNFLPTRMLPGFAYASWSDSGGVVRVAFRNKAGWKLEWRVQPMSGACADGSTKTFQLDGNKVWWAQIGAEQEAWRCVFALDGKPLRLVAASTTPPSKLAASGLGVVAASATRY